MKKFAKMVLGAIPATLTIGVAINAVEDFFQKKADKAKADEMKAVEAEDQATSEAFRKFARLNEINDNDMKYVSDSGYTPIFAYDRKLNIEKMRIPKGYTLIHLIQPSGAMAYALGEKLADEVSENYHILAYFVDDWHDDLD